MIGKLLGWTGIPQWLLEVGVVVAVVGGIWLSGVFHEKGVEKVRVVKEQVQVEKRVIETDHSHDQELADLRQYRSDHPIGSFRVSIRPCPPATPEGRSSASASDLQPVPAGNPDVSSGPDVSGLLDLLAARADEVSAALRRRQALEP